LIKLLNSYTGPPLKKRNTRKAYTEEGDEHPEWVIMAVEQLDDERTIPALVGCMPSGERS
jgi:hypothetical protein